VGGWLGRVIRRAYYVPFCSICDQAVHPPLPSPSVCRLCLSRLPFRMDREAVGWDGPFPLFATFFYREPLTEILVSIKFAGRTDRAMALAPLMARTVLCQGLEADAIIPLPLHENRRRRRGYNQAALLAEGLSEELSIPSLDKLLVRWRDTRRQSETTSLKERLEHLEGAFRLSSGSRLPAELRGRTVLLVDDILTSGATMKEAAKPLLQTGLRPVGLVAATGRDRYRAYGEAMDQW